MTAKGIEMQIPEDLKRRYEHSKNWLERNREQHPLLRMSPEAHDNFIRIELIERIGRLESENKQLREALEARRVADEMWRDDAPHNLCHSQTKHAQELSRAALQQATGKESQ